MNSREPSDSTEPRENLTNSELVEEFHRVFGLPHGRPPGVVPERVEFRLELIREELKELEEAFEEGDIEAVADALGDLLYVVYGAGLEFGVPLDEVVAEIHDSNMSKLWSTEEAEEAVARAGEYPEERRPDRSEEAGGGGRVVYRADGKVLKGPRFREPELGKLLEDRQGYKDMQG